MIKDIELEPKPGPKFKLGNIVMTANAERQIPLDEMMIALQRHQHGDWGDVCEQDRKTNEEALELGNRLMSVYKSERELEVITFWIITEWDRSVTTVLLPEDY